MRLGWWLQQPPQPPLLSPEWWAMAASTPFPTPQGHSVPATLIIHKACRRREALRQRESPRQQVQASVVKCHPNKYAYPESATVHADCDTISTRLPTVHRWDPDTAVGEPAALCHTRSSRVLHIWDGSHPSIIIPVLQSVPSDH